MLFRGGGLSLSENADEEAIAEMLDTMDLYEYRLSPDERKLAIIVELLMRPERSCSAQELASLMYTARNTVINDCKVVESYLALRNVSLNAQGKLGLSIQLSAEQRRDLLIDVFAEILRGRMHQSDFMSQYVERRLGYCYPIDRIVQLMRVFQRENNTLITKEAECEIAACLHVELNDIAQCQSLGEEHDHIISHLDFVGRMIAYVASNVGLKNQIGRKQIAEMERLILSRDLLPQIKAMSDFDLYCTLSHFLWLVSGDLGIDVQKDDLLIEALSSHVKSMIDWTSDAFELKVSGPSGAMVEMVRSAADPYFPVLEHYLHRRMDTSMRSSIVIHICAALYRAESSIPPCRVVIACPGSLATSKYLEAQIKRYFHFDVMGTTTIAKLSPIEMAKQGIDFVVSTVPIKDIAIPVVTVAPMLTVEDVNKIQARVFRRKCPTNITRSASSKSIDRLNEIYASGNTRKIEYLDKAINRILFELSNSESEMAKASTLLNMLQIPYIGIWEGELAWRKAIGVASEQLLQDGYISSNYVRRAIENVEEFGAYIVVSEGIALAHAAHQDGAYKDGLSLLVSRDGIVFDGGERAYLMFFFVQSSDEEYLNLFKEIVRLGNNQDYLKRVRYAQSPEQVRQQLIEILAVYSEEGKGHEDKH